MTDGICSFLTLCRQVGEPARRYRTGRPDRPPSSMLKNLQAAPKGSSRRGNRLRAPALPGPDLEALEASSDGLAAPAQRLWIEQLGGEVGVRFDALDRHACKQLAVEEHLLPEWIEEVFHETAVVRQREVDQPVARREPLPGDETDDAPFGIEPDRGARPVARARPDHG